MEQQVELLAQGKWLMSAKYTCQWKIYKLKVALLFSEIMSGRTSNKLNLSSCPLALTSVIRASKPESCSHGFSHSCPPPFPHAHSCPSSHCSVHPGLRPTCAGLSAPCCAFWEGWRMGWKHISPSAAWLQYPSCRNASSFELWFICGGGQGMAGLRCLNQTCQPAFPFSSLCPLD